jgi:hypothetical protein
MPTKLSRFCLGVMEAAWLAAVSLIPLFFNIYSSRIFEPDKIAILRSLAILTLGAWAVKLVNEGGVKWNSEERNQSFFRYLLTYPLVAPIFSLIIVYIISTIFSVTPSISLLGSYQRLQGTYTTFSYLIIFFSIIANLRNHEQISRFITLIIFTSLPISLYGFLQKYNLDPIPWGGNVSIRIASSMGNSIFVAAYLIMVFPLTVGRIIESLKAILTADDNHESKLQTSKNIIRATIYIFIAIVELIAIYMSGSRGPLLGLLAGGYFMLLLLSIYWKTRWLSFTVIGLAVVGVVFLAVFNINNGPLEALRKSPAVGRFGNLLNSESNSALVRQYIWEGDVKLAGIHAPLVFPNGSTDKFNILRPLIGYGPESMYVAYNQFYQPELGQVEKRNASPDRSHNETWDSIIITGGLGLLVYLAIFSGVFYYGLSWLGMIISRRDKFFFWLCLVGGGIIGTIALIIFKGVEYLGVGLPFGMVVGVVAYLTVHSIISPLQENDLVKKNPYSLLMIVIFAAIVGHFIEINFGIAIVATRTLFWSYSGILLVVGFILPKLTTGDVDHTQSETVAVVKESPSGRKRERTSAKSYKKSDNNKRPLLGDRPDWFRNAMIGAVMIGMIMATLGYDFITNSDHSTSFVHIIISSLTTLPNKGNVFSLGLLMLLFIPTWIFGTLLFASEINGIDDDRTWLKTFGLMAGVALGIGVLFWLFHAISLVLLAAFVPQNQNDVITQVNGIGSLLTKYYIYIFLLLILLGFLLPDEWPSKRLSKSSLGIVTLPVALVLVVLIVLPSNLKVIHADITFKMAEPFANSAQWQVATFLYKRALELAPKEDHYYLFLGRSYLETAKQTSATADQDKLVLQAESDLKVAQSINPLNTDHTANLARLYTWWAGKAAAQSDTRTQRAQKASDYYATAVELSPNNSTLWDEWAVLYMQLIGQPDQAYQRLQHALSLDPQYNYTQGLLGDYYQRVASSTNNISEKQQALEKARDYYKTAADVSKYTDVNTKASYIASMANIYAQLATLNPDNVDNSQYQQAIAVLQQYIDAGLRANDLWQVQETLAKLYIQIGDKANAQYYAGQALDNAPSSATDRIQALITQTQSLP